MDRVGPAGDAEDIVQTVMLRVVEAHRRRPDDLRTSPGYVLRVATHLVVDELRRKFRHVEVSPGEDDDLERAAGPHSPPDREARAREISHGIRDCLTALVDARRRAVTMHLLGHTLAEVGTTLGWTRKRAEHLVYRGLGDMRRCLGSKGLTP